MMPVSLVVGEIEVSNGWRRLFMIAIGLAETGRLKRPRTLQREIWRRQSDAGSQPVCEVRTATVPLQKTLPPAAWKVAPQFS